MKNKTFSFQKMDFLSIGQKDAQWSVSPLRVRMKRVWALRARLATVFGGSLIRGGGRAGRAGRAANVCRTNKRRFAAKIKMKNKK